MYNIYVYYLQNQKKKSLKCNKNILNILLLQAFVECIKLSIKMNEVNECIYKGCLCMAMYARVHK